MHLKFEDFINESLSEVLYHYSSIDNIIEILESNQFLLSSSLGTDADNMDSKVFFLSFARTKSTKVGYALSSHNNARIVLDGKKLNNTYKGKPVDYWQRKSPDDPIYTGQSSYKDKLYMQNRGFEYEDRLYSDSPYLKPATKYILRIELWDVNAETNANTIQRINNLKALCDKMKIPIFVYATESDLNRGVNAITDQFNSGDNSKRSLYKGSDYGINAYLETLCAILLYNKDYFYDYAGLEVVFNKFVKDNNLPSELRLYRVHEIMRSLLYNLNDSVNGLMGQYHNEFKGGQDTALRKTSHLLTKEFKKYNVHSISELANLKIRGLLPKNSPKRKDWDKKVKFKYTPKYDGDVFSMDLLLTEIDNYLYLITWKYNGQLSDDDWDVLYAMKSRNRTLGEFVNYLFNKYSTSHALDVLNKSVCDGENLTFYL